MSGVEIDSLNDKKAYYIAVVGFFYSDSYFIIDWYIF